MYRLQSAIRWTTRNAIRAALAALLILIGVVFGSAVATTVTYARCDCTGTQCDCTGTQCAR